MAQPKQIQKELQAVRRSLRTLDAALDRLGRSLRRSASAGGAPSPRRLKLSPKRRAALKLRGRYLGHIRLLKPAQKAKVKAARAKRGYHAAIRMAKRIVERTHAR